MTTFCTTEDVEALLQGDIDPDDDPKIVALLEMATELFELELGRPAADLTERVETFTAAQAWNVGRPLTLARWPIASVGSVVEAGTGLVAGTTYTVDLEAGIIRRIYDADGYPYPWPAGVPIVVTYTPAHPRGFRSIAAQIVARAFKAGRNYSQTPTVLAGLRQLTIGRWSATAQGETGQTAAEALSLTDAERAAVRAYRDRL